MQRSLDWELGWILGLYFLLFQKLIRGKVSSSPTSFLGQILVPCILGWFPANKFAQTISITHLTFKFKIRSIQHPPPPNSPLSDRFLELSGLLTISHHGEMGNHALDYKPTFPVIHCLTCNFILDSPRRFPNDLDTGLRETKSILSFRYEDETIDPVNQTFTLRTGLDGVSHIPFHVSLPTPPPSLNPFPPPGMRSTSVKRLAGMKWQSLAMGQSRIHWRVEGWVEKQPDIARITLGLKAGNGDLRSGFFVCL